MERSTDECTSLRLKKSSLTLDLSSSRSGRKATAASLQGHCLPSSSVPPPAPSLSSPTSSTPRGIIAASPAGTVVGDLDALKLSTPECGGLLKLTTAELERFLLQPNAPLLASPATPLLFVKPTNEEQEAYARGFMDALFEIRRKQLNSFGGLVCLDGPPGSAVTPSLMALTPVSPFAPLTADAIAAGGLCPQLVPVNLASLSSRANATTVMTSGQQQSRSSPETQRRDSSPMMVKESPHIGSRPNSQAEQIALSNTPPQSPIDMTDQERIKLERKREKNRRAAQKCRTRKLERIARLEHRTRELRQQNARLVQEADEVKEQLLSLKGQIAEHFRNGCFSAKGSDA